MIGKRHVLCRHSISAVLRDMAGGDRGELPAGNDLIGFSVRNRQFYADHTERHVLTQPQVLAVPILPLAAGRSVANS